MGGLVFTVSQIQNGRRLIQAGGSPIEIARDLGLSRATLRRRLRELRVSFIYRTDDYPRESARSTLPTGGAHAIRVSLRRQRCLRSTDAIELLGLATGLTIVLGLQGITGPASAQTDDSGTIALAAEASPSSVPSTDDPDAVAEYLKLLAEYRSSNTSARAAAASGPCLSGAVKKTVSQGTTISVYRTVDAPRLVCSNAAQAVYDNEYKPMVASAYEGQKRRDQLVCQISNAWDKRPWNLDPWRPNVGYAATVAALCNP
ncbi:uncharacterized protein DUF2599 [Labedella gwakjiensis]|nr:uncharacterized protein DUF2599 [Labedella gwakjiensis]